MAHRHLLVSSPLALLAAFFVSSPAFALTPECEEDADCGAGFVCEVTYGSANGGNTGGAAGTGSGSGGGAGAAALCGDGACHFTETAETCSADCVEVHYCAPAPCDDSADCAMGYFCQASTPPGTGGTGPAWCGDGICTTGEDVENCADDCAVTGVCAVEWNGCTSNADCPDGFYCDLPSSGSGSGGISGAGGDTGAGGFATGGSAGTVGSGGAGGAEGGTGGSTGGMASGGTSAGGQSGDGSAEFAAPRPEGGSGGLSDPLPGACLPTGGGSGGAPGTGGVASGGVGAVSAGGSAGAETGGTGAADGGTAGTTTTGTGATGSGATGSGATGGTSSNTGGTSGTGSASGGMAGGDGPKGDHGGGCSYSASSNASPFGLLAGLALLFARGRRRSARR